MHVHTLEVMDQHPIKLQSEQSLEVTEQHGIEAEQWKRVWGLHCLLIPV